MTAPTDADYASLVANTRAGLPPPQGWREIVVPGNLNRDGSTGLIAGAYVNSAGQIAMVFVGPLTSPGGINVFGRPGGAATDSVIMSGMIPTDYNNSITAFVTAVKDTANTLNYNTNANNIFVAGTSLGGYAAEYASWTWGYGGASYGGPGSPQFSLAPPTSLANPFKSEVIYGDPVANWSTDTGVSWDGCFKMEEVSDLTTVRS